MNKVSKFSDYRLTDEMLKKASRQQRQQPTPPGRPPKTRRPKGELFTMVPKAWSDLLADAKSAATFKVALHLLHHHWEKKGASLVLANTTVKGVTRAGKRTALAELAARGLVTIEHRRDKSPSVRVLQ